MKVITHINDILNPNLSLDNKNGHHNTSIQNRSIRIQKTSSKQARLTIRPIKL